MRAIRKRVKWLDATARECAVELLGREPLYTIVVADLCKGYCNYADRVLVIPAWTFHGTVYQKAGCPTIKSAVEPDYHKYYIAHELAHMVAWELDHYRGQHGAGFMFRFKQICPKHLWYCELAYKPRFAKAAGITPKD